MTPVRFVVWRGTAPTLRFTLNPVVAAGIVGWTLRFSARKLASDPDPLVLDLTGIVIDPVACIIDVPMTKAQTLALTVRNYDVSLERITVGAEDLLAVGVMVVKYDVRNAK